VVVLKVFTGKKKYKAPSKLGLSPVKQVGKQKHPFFAKIKLFYPSAFPLSLKLLIHLP